MCVVIGGIIGVGVFFNGSRMAELTQSGSMMLLAWGIGGVIALCGALVFAELGGRYNGNGAQYEVLRDAYGPMPAFLYVFCNATAIQTAAIGVIATVCADNIFVALNIAAPEGYGRLGIAAVLIALVTAANIIGVMWGSSIQNFTVFAKLITIVVVTGIAALMGKADVMAAAHPAVASNMNPWLGLVGALIPAMFAYGGWQQALWISGEVREPQKNLPRSIIGGVVIVVVVYMLANWAYLRLLGIEAVASSKTLAADAVAAVYPSTGKRVIAGAVALSAFGVLNAQLLAGPRLVYGMARDGRFFRIFGELHKGRGTPVAAILLLSVTATGLLFAAGFNGVDRLTTGAVFIDCVFFILTGLAVFVLRRRGQESTFRLPGYPVVPALFVIGEVGALVGAYVKWDTASAAWIGMAWIAGAALLYLLFFNRERLPPPPACQSCGYPTVGLTGDVCPECGKSLAEPTTAQ